jgi:hypothetical protein
MDGLKGNAESYNALMQYVGPEVRSGLQDATTVMRSITKAMAAKGPPESVFPKASGFLGKLFKLGAAHAGTVAANAAGLPIPTGAIEGFVAARLLTESPIAEALTTFITSPAGRSAIEAAAGGAPVNPGFLRNIARSVPFRNLMDAANIPPSQTYRWLEKALKTGAVGSPLRAGIAQQMEEN